VKFLLSPILVSLRRATDTAHHVKVQARRAVRGFLRCEHPPNADGYALPTNGPPAQRTLLFF